MKTATSFSRTRRSAALLITLVLLLHGIRLSPSRVFAQQPNTNPLVASQEPPNPGPSPTPPESNSLPPGTNSVPDSPSGTPRSWVLIPLVPVVGVLWWLFQPSRPVNQPVPINTSPPPALDNVIPAIVVCPTLSVSCPPDVDQGSSIRFDSSLSVPAEVTYNWSVSAGAISSGQGTPSIIVDTNNLGGQTVTATLELVGLDPSCSGSASCASSVRPVQPPASKFDEFGPITFNDEKARLDNFAIELKNTPSAQGYIVAYGTCVREAQERADRAKEYLIYSRGVDAGRLETIDGGCQSNLAVQLWVVPTGATPPAANAGNIISPCPECKRPAPRRTQRRRRVR